ncbi:hypothetical protein AVEN_205848-1 [Araneus ventricosus]|uniref:Uncharacterized protein n=1 Tax=Araneus ventricosus TaxID=182803 RepID=A0A4Y2PUY6_ARAVE|nr:hypothetical protein AVEN_205848-1 [Araneus ventricosus]
MGNFESGSDDDSETCGILITKIPCLTNKRKFDQWYTRTHTHTADLKWHETETKEEMDIAELKESLQALKEVQTLIQEFPTILEAAKLCRKAKTKQERILIVLNALVKE